MKRQIYKPKKGLIWNPLRGYPRNLPCFCGKTDKKAKHCCLPRILPAIPQEEALKLSQYMKHVNENK